jgi:hypothetical protein
MSQERLTSEQNENSERQIQKQNDLEQLKIYYDTIIDGITNNNEFERQYLEQFTILLTPYVKMVPKDYVKEIGERANKNINKID